MAEVQDNLVADAFRRDGFVTVRGLIDADTCATLRARVAEALQPLSGPAEYEADVGYPGAPNARDAAGGQTPRRLLHAYSRDAGFRALGTGAAVAAHLAALFDAPPQRVLMSQCHHNCVMTKHPGFSSATMWHQDIRYWSFDRPELISVWIALTAESPRNGALRLLPGSHRATLDRGRFDRDLFLRTDLADNRALIDTAADVSLEPGDALFFHCRTLHAAGRNETAAVKLSCVFTYHTDDNRPIPGTRSAQYPGIRLDPERRP